MNLLDLLVAGDVETFNDTRGTRQQIELFAVELAEARLSGVDLSNANLEKSDLTGADLSDAQLFKANLAGIDGAGLNLSNAVGTRCRLKEAYLEGADLSGAELSRSDLKEAMLAGTKGEGVRFVGSRLIEVDAHDAVWPRADLSEAHLHKANLSGADLRGANLADVLGSGVDLSNARLDAATASRAKLQQAKLVGASAMGIRLEGADLTGADLSGADLSAADLSGADLTGAILTGTVLRGAVLAHAVLDGVDLTAAELADADLTGHEPGALGLTDAQRGALSAHGASVDADAPLRFADPSVARNGDAVLAVWLNADDEEKRSVRWCLTRAGREPAIGVLPDAAEGVLARAVTADPTGGGFAVVLLKQRPGGVALVRYPLGVDGGIGPAQTEPLGYDPLLVPVARTGAGTAWMWGVARRGPTMVVHKLGDEGFGAVRSETVATASAFLGRHAPILACKGGVVLSFARQGAGTPLRTPDRFPGARAVAAAVDDRVLVVWLEPRLGDIPGGLRAAWLAKRGAPEVITLTRRDGVADLDAMAAGETVWLAWIEGDGATAKVLVNRVDAEGAEDAMAVSVPGRPTSVRFAPGDLDAADRRPILVVTTAGGGLAVVDVGGTVIGRVGE